MGVLGFATRLPRGRIVLLQGVVSSPSLKVQKILLEKHRLFLDKRSIWKLQLIQYQQ